MQSGKCPGPDGFPTKCFKQFSSLLSPQLGATSSDSFKLLNTDVKIFAKILARRLENILPTIISKDQMGFVKGRHSYLNIRGLLNIMHSSTEEVLECIVFLDAEKAFDRVEFDYLFTILHRFDQTSSHGLNCYTVSLQL